MRSTHRPRRRRQLAGHPTRSTPPTSSISPPTTEPPKVEPAWWVRDILVAGTVAVIVGAITASGTIVAQQRIDDARADRELRAANLTFVRERSSTDPLLPRPFTGLDLRDQNLSGLDLRNADFSTANLSGARLIGAALDGAILVGATLPGASLGLANLSEAVLAFADLRGVVLYGANLSDANLHGARLGGADLRGADLSSANLKNAVLTGVCWKDPSPLQPPQGKLPDARWPQGFTPPPSTETSCDSTLTPG